MPSLGVIMQDTVEGPRPHRLTQTHSVFRDPPSGCLFPFPWVLRVSPPLFSGALRGLGPCVCVRPPAELRSLNKPHRAGLGRASPVCPGLTPLRRVFTTSGVSRLRRGRDCPLTTVHRSLQTTLDPPTFLLITDGEGIERGRGGSVCSSKCIYPRCDHFFFPREALKMPTKHRLTCHLSSISDVGLLGPCTKRGVRVGCTPCLEGAGRG